ncbi:ATP-binding protein [Phytohalomonas tamaricis]|uniref:ATP-binding protein n=1 Tax=Phytohalomonas tamaricis TaxID=2081032 RepID=UPI000D0B0140|nr:ATP-binding protein [Phytohalomonas tamaricis]
MHQPLPLSTPNLNLIRLTIARGISWTGFLGAIIFGIEVIGFQLHVLPIITTIVLMGLINVATWWRLGQPRAVTDTEYVIHLLFDIIGLTVVFYFTGGSTNPVVMYYLVPITIAAATLSWRHTLIIAIAAILAYTFLMLFYEPLPELRDTIFGTAVSLHVLGMWLTFGLCTVLVTFFIYKMAHALRHRDSSLSRTREAVLRNEQILAVASQAAGTAHELGTPLATMAVLLSEMREDAKDNALLQEDIALLKGQVESCKKHLRALVANAERHHADKPQYYDLVQWFEKVVQHWLVIRPDVTYQLNVAGKRQAQIAVDTTLEQALMNLLNNAADANPDDIELQLDWSEEEVVIDIRDHGPGIPLEIAHQLGDTFVSTKSKGMGIGLFLTHSTINRFGGGVRLYNHEDGGTLTEVRLPRASERA